MPQLIEDILSNDPEVVKLREEITRALDEDNHDLPPQPTKEDKIVKALLQLGKNQKWFLEQLKEIRALLPAQLPKTTGKKYNA